MQIQKVNSAQNTSFGLLYTDFLSKNHQNLIKPIFPKLAGIGKHVDIVLSTTMGPAKKGSDYTIFTECIEIKAHPKANSKTIGKTVIERVFTNKLLGKGEKELKAGREEILNAAFSAAKESLRPLTLNA
ncbi:MAG: hypothetical protein K6A44_03860 [bacterium]|nr:hypothetical protein [bacterium]